MAGGVALGEVSRGAGKIRFVGALLPDPEVRYDHPYGLASYALTYTGWQLFENVVQWQRPALPDLALDAADFAFSPQRIVQGDRVTITATVRNRGRAAAADVAVRFADNGVAIGPDQVIASIPAGGSGTASATWDTRDLQGRRTITVTADPANRLVELDETNNSASQVVRVRGNRVQNGSFESSSDGRQPDHWSSSGGTSYSHGGSDGERSASADGTGTWTSDPVAVEPGRTYGVSVDTSGAAGSLVVEQRSATGVLLAATTQALAGVADGRFQAAAGRFTTAAEAAQVRVKLAGGLVGTTFDDVRLWEE